MRPIALMLIPVLLLAGCGAAQADAEPALETDDQKTLYALGLAVSRNLSAVDLAGEDLDIVLMGIRDGVSGADEKASLEEFGPRIETLMRERVEAKTARLEEEGAAFVSEMAAADGAVRSDSGMIYFDEVVGDGASPGPTDRVKLHYRGSFPDGKEFDSSLSGDPVEFSLSAVVACFTEGVGGMNVGGKRKLVCPPELGYGDRGYAPMVPPGATLVFEIELFDIVTPEAAPSISTPESSDG